VTNGIRLGPFTLVACIGRGGMGAVWRAQTEDAPGPAASAGAASPLALPVVAVKVLQGEGARSPAFRARFREEVFSAARLQHPSIVSLYDQGTVPAAAASRTGGALVEGSPYLVMELATGGTLADWRPPVPWPALRATLRALLGALAHAHARRVVHRDLKPANVLLAGPGDLRPGPKLSDFGLAHVAGRAAADDGALAGTPPYMSPEQIHGRARDYGPWTDLYSLGCLAWELVTGHTPFGRATPHETARAHLRDAPPPFSPVTGVPPGLEAWLRRLLEKEPPRRFQLAADAAFALERLAPEPQPAAAAAPQAGCGVRPPPATTVRWQPDPATRLADAATGGSTVGATSGTLPELAAPAPVTPPEEDRPPVPPSWSAGSASDRVIADAAAERLRRLGIGLELWGLTTPPFVGRRAERDVLWGALRTVAAGGGPRVLVLRGRAGSGRTRLARFLVERAEEAGAATSLWVSHAAHPGPADGLAAALARRLRCEGLGAAARRERVRALLADLGSCEPHEALAVAELVAPSGDEREGSAASPAERSDVAWRLVRRLARGRPLVLCLDDAQWGYESLGFLLDGLAAGVDAPVLALVTAQDEALAERPLEAGRLQQLRSRPETATLPVGPLPPHEHTALVQGLAALEDRAAARVAERTGGSPLFAVQLVGDWVQRGVLERGPRGLQLRTNAGTVPLPADLRAIWSTRVESLLGAAGARDDDRVALELAAVGGDDVTNTAWGAACAVEGVRADPGLVERLFAARLARSAGRADAGAGLPDWVFAHPALREAVVVASGAAGRLERHHAAWAAILGPGYDAGDRSLAARLARHRLGAGQDAAALEPLRSAVALSSGRGEHALADDLLSRHAAALDRLRRPEDDPERGENLAWRAQVALDTGDLTGARAAAERVRRSAAAGGAGGWEGVLRRALATLAWAATREGRLDEAEPLFADARRRCERAGDAGGAARALEGLASVSTYRGALDGALRYLDEALLHARRAADPAAEAAVLLRMAHNARIRDREAECLDRVARARSLYDRLGNATGVGRCLALEAEVARARGDLTAAEEGARRALSRIGAGGSLHSHLAPLNVGLVLIERRLHDEARRVLLRVLETLEVSGQRGYAGVVHALLLPTVAAARDWTAWDHHCGEALARLEGFVDRDVAAMAERAGELLREGREWGRARTALGLALTQWRALGRRDAVERIERALAALPPAGGDGPGHGQSD
jgi:tetratricopeptide (TPR) repeat protein